MDDVDSGEYAQEEDDDNENEKESCENVDGIAPVSFVRGAHGRIFVRWMPSCPSTAMYVEKDSYLMRWQEASLESDNPSRHCFISGRRRLES